MSSFNLPSRLLASPRASSPMRVATSNSFQSAKQITGFPKRAPASHHNPSSASFNLPSRLLASPSLMHGGGCPKCPYVSICQADYWLPQGRRRLHRRGEEEVSICQADYWLPQGRSGCQVHEVQRFNLPSRLLASPRASLRRASSRTPRFQSAKQITGFPKTTLLDTAQGGSEFQSAKQITGFPKVSVWPGVGQLSRFQSAKQITGFPKRLTRWALSAESLFQSAKQITGFPKADEPAPRIRRRNVSICQADYWLPQAVTNGFFPRLNIRVSICQADYWLPQVPETRGPIVLSAVSICQADYWLPQVEPDRDGAHRVIGFQSAKQITGFPKFLARDVGVMGAAVSICQADYWLPQGFSSSRRQTTPRCFNLPSRLLASPSTSARQFRRAIWYGFNLPSRLLASPRKSDARAFSKQQCVSICQADYWLPQV